MTHRGAVGSDARDGDGAGVMTSIPHKFFVKNFAREAGIRVPSLGQYAAGNLFFKPDTETLKESITSIRRDCHILGLRVLGWREVPRDSTLLGPGCLVSRANHPAAFRCAAICLRRGKQARDH